MNKSDVTEIKKRLKKDKCAFNRIAGCCVGNEKQILTTFNQPFLTMEEGDQHKFLEIASKTLSGKLGNNLLELDFPNEAEDDGGTQNFLMKLRDGSLKNDDDLKKLYQQVIDSYEHTGTYAIILFHDAYDVPCKGTDKRSLDESEEVYTYIICAICPIDLSKPGLSYFVDEKCISERVRDWVLGAPEAGFTFPAFTDRSTDIHAALYYTKTTKDPHQEFVNEVLGCDLPQTADEKKEAFSVALSEVFEDEKNPPRLIYDINESLRQMIEIEEDVEDPETGEVKGTRTRTEDVEVNDSVLKEALLENDIPEDKIKELQEAFKESISGDTSVDQIIDRKLLESEKHRRIEEDLRLEILELKKENEKLRKELGR